jgi:hypothetical protein
MVEEHLSFGMLSCWYQLQIPEDGGDIFSETCFKIRATQHKVPEFISNLYRREIIREDSILRSLISALVVGEWLSSQPCSTFPGKILPCTHWTC